MHRVAPIMLKRIRKHANTKEAERAVLQTLFFFVLPTVLLYFRIIPIEGRIPVLLIFSLLIYGVIKKEGWTAKDLGLSTKTIRPALPAYTLATLLALVGVILFANALGMPPTEHWWVRPHFLFLFLVVSFFQEFAFRSFLMPVLSRVFPDSLTIVLVNALLFAGMHAIYPFPEVGLPFAFAGGLFFALLYKRYPNLILVTLSHAVINFAAVWYGFFTISH